MRTGPTPERLEGHFEAIRRPNLVDEVISQITDLIASGVLKPGERLPSERDLAARLKVGRSSIREALKSLTLMGILEARPGQGWFVRQTHTPTVLKTLEFAMILGKRNIQELVEARFIIEPEIAALAAQRCTDEDLGDLEQAMHRMEAAAVENSVGFVEADVEFHVVLARAAGNSVLFHVMQTIRDLLHVWIDRVTRRPESMAETVQEHRRILDAVRARDPVRARQAVAEHLRHATKRLLDGYNELTRGVEP